jgi:excisionase family DNA binding protein
MPDRLLTIGETAELLGVGISTLRHWDETSQLVAVRTPGGHRRYRLSSIERFQGLEASDENEDVTAVYVRVSSHDQKKKGDLDRQKGRVLEYCAKSDYQVGYILSDVASGMSDNRAKIRRLIKLASDGKINRVVVEHKDRLSRFMVGVFVDFFGSHGVTLEWIEESLPKSYEAELVEDILALMASFSAKLYGRRSAERRRKKKADGDS